MPTPAAFKERFPAFADVSDTLIQAVLDETTSFVDHTWIASDIVTAKMYLAAHILVSEGVLNLETAGVGGVAGIGSVKVGDTAVTFKAAVAGFTGNDAALASTSYGQRFLALRKRSVPAVAVAR